MPVTQEEEVGGKVKKGMIVALQVMFSWNKMQKK